MVNLKGVPFVLVDTAGIIKSHDLVESLGVERSRQAIEQADLVLLVVDRSQRLTAADREILDLLGEKTVLVSANKSDLPWKAALDELPWPVVFICALTGDGVAELEERMVSTVFGGKVFASDALLVSNPRHKEALARAERHVAQAQTSLEADMPDDFITIDLTAALSALGEITGETVQDELLETIFSQFCIGK